MLVLECGKFGMNGRLEVGLGVWKAGHTVRKLEYMETEARNLTPEKVNVPFYFKYYVLELHYSSKLTKIHVLRTSQQSPKGKSDALSLF